MTVRQCLDLKVNCPFGVQNAICKIWPAQWQEIPDEGAVTCFEKAENK
jgi:hypothetical protein